MNHSIQTIIVILLMAAAGTALSGCSNRSKAERDKLTDSSQPTSDQAAPEPATIPAIDVANSESEEPKDLLEFGQLSDADLARTSWENPFRPRLWACDGWKINEDSMTSESELPQPATFLRPYRNVVVECRFSRSGEVDSPSDLPPIEFELRLRNRDSQRLAILSHTSGKITLSESDGEASSAKRPLREYTQAVSSDSQDVEVRLTMTPNRILVVVNGQMRINSPRPTSVLNADCLPQFMVREPGIALTDVRFEGD